MASTASTLLRCARAIKADSFSFAADTNISIDCASFTTFATDERFQLLSIQHGSPSLTHCGLMVVVAIFPSVGSGADGKGETSAVTDACKVADRRGRTSKVTLACGFGSRSFAAVK